MTNMQGILYRSDLSARADVVRGSGTETRMRPMNGTKNQTEAPYIRQGRDGLWWIDSKTDFDPSLITYATGEDGCLLWSKDGLLMIDYAGHPRPTLNGPFQSYGAALNIWTMGP